MHPLFDWSIVWGQVWNCPLIVTMPFLLFRSHTFWNISHLDCLSEESYTLFGSNPKLGQKSKTFDCCPKIFNLFFNLKQSKKIVMFLFSVQYALNWFYWYHVFWIPGYLNHLFRYDFIFIKMYLPNPLTLEILYNTLVL